MHQRINVNDNQELVQIRATKAILCSNLESTMVTRKVILFNVDAERFQYIPVDQAEKQRQQEKRAHWLKKAEEKRFIFNLKQELVGDTRKQSMGQDALGE
jgi:hypothetical protein